MRSASKCQTCTVQALCRTAINIAVADATTYNAKATPLTCFVENREKPQSGYEPEPSWEQALVKDTALGNAVADVNDSDSHLADAPHPLPTSRKRDEQPNLRP